MKCNRKFSIVVAKWHQRGVEPVSVVDLEGKEEESLWTLMSHHLRRNNLYLNLKRRLMKCPNGLNVLYHGHQGQE